MRSQLSWRSHRELSAMVEDSYPAARAALAVPITALNDADAAIGLEHSQLDLVDRCDSVLTQRGLQVRGIKPLLLHGLVKPRAVTRDGGWRGFEHQAQER